MTFTEASQRLAQAAEKRRKQIQRARAYYELKEEAKKVQISTVCLRENSVTIHFLKIAINVKLFKI